MKLGEFDEIKAKNQAKSYLIKSITILSSLINVDYTSINENSTNPFIESDPYFKAFECLKAEIIAYKKIEN